MAEARYMTDQERAALQEFYKEVIEGFKVEFKVEGE